MRRSISILTLVLCLAAPAVYAEVIVFDNSPPDQSSGNEMTQWIQAEDIPLAAPITFDRIRFWSLEDLVFGTGYAGSIDWFLYSEVLVPVEGDPTNLMGQPGAVLYSGSTAAVTRTFLGTANGPGFSEYVNLFVTGPITLAAGNYWLGLHNGPVADFARAESIGRPRTPTSPSRDRSSTSATQPSDGPASPERSTRFSSRSRPRSGFRNPAA